MLTTLGARARICRSLVSRASPTIVAAMADKVKGSTKRQQRRVDALARRKERDAKGTSFKGGVTKQFEFSAADNPKFARLAQLMTAAGMLDLLIALLGIVGLYLAGLSLPGGATVLALAAVPPVAVAAVGMWTMRAGQRFGLVAATRHSDVTHLMGAVDELTKLFLLQVVAAAVGIGSAMLSVVLATSYGSP